MYLVVYTVYTTPYHPGYTTVHTTPVINIACTLVRVC